MATYEECLTGLTYREIETLLKPVYETPNKRGVRQVVADQLIERGHPYGEFIQASIRAHLAMGEEKVMWEQYAESLLAPHRLEWTWALGRIVWPEVKYVAGFPIYAEIDPTRLAFFVDQPAWATYRHLFLSSWHSEVDGALLAKFIQQKSLSQTLEWLSGDAPLDTFCALAKGPMLRALTSMAIHAEPTEVIHRLPDFREAMPRLYALSLRYRGTQWSPQHLRALIVGERLCRLNMLRLLVEPEQDIEALLRVARGRHLDLWIWFGDRGRLIQRRDGSLEGHFPSWDTGRYNVLSILQNLSPMTSITLRVGEWTSKTQLRTLMASLPAAVVERKPPFNPCRTMMY